MAHAFASSAAPPAAPAPANDADTVFSTIVIGTGFSGLGMGIALRQAGVHDFVLLERAGDIGGTWRDNRYPGCACDVQSHLYSYSFEPNPGWSRKFAPQAEIQAYLRHCAGKYGLEPHLRLHADVIRARHDDASALWQITTADGRQWRARAVVAGMGALSNPQLPDIEGRDSFAGRAFHTAQWPDGIDLRGQRVAVIGSAASAIQTVPQLAPQVARLDYYQRTPSWVMPKFDGPVSPRWQAWYRRWPLLQKLARGGIYTLLESRAPGFTRVPQLMGLLRSIGKWHLHRHVKDPAKRALLLPAYTPGCKRVLLSDDYYPALALPQVQIVNTPIARITPQGIVTQDGSLREVDVIVYATGFAVQQPVPRGAITGSGGRDLLDAWPHGPEAYLGMAVAGFPNLFFLMGPNTGLGHSSMVYMIESQIRYVAQALQHLRRHGQPLAVQPAVQRRFAERVQAQLARTVWASGCHSWYLNASGRNTTLWPGFTFTYRRATRRFDPADYAAAAPADPSPLVRQN